MIGHFSRYFPHAGEFLSHKLGFKYIHNSSGGFSFYITELTNGSLKIDFIYKEIRNFD